MVFLVMIDKNIICDIVVGLVENVLLRILGSVPKKLDAIIIVIVIYFIFLKLRLIFNLGLICFDLTFAAICICFSIIFIHLFNCFFFNSLLFIIIILYLRIFNLFFFNCRLFWLILVNLFELFPFISMCSNFLSINKNPFIPINNSAVFVS